MNGELDKLRRKHSQLNDRDGNPIDPRVAGKVLLSDPRGSTRTVTKASQMALLDKIKSNLSELEKFAAKLPRGSMRQRSVLKYIVELQAEVRNREQFIR